jgi:hypothetical protein
MASALKIAEAAVGPQETVVPAIRLERHVAEFQDFFKTRSVAFGAARDLPPFMQRLRADDSFGADIGSMLRTVIYRERDGFSHLELVELLTSAVGGPHADDAETPEIRAAVRDLMLFVESVFRARWNPGAAKPRGTANPGPAAAKSSSQTRKAAAAEPHPLPASGLTAEAASTPRAAPEHIGGKQPLAKEPSARPAPLATREAAPAPPPAPHAMTDLFYRARMVAGADAETSSPPDRPKLVLAPEPATPEPVLLTPAPQPLSAERSKLVLTTEPAKPEVAVQTPQVKPEAGPLLQPEAAAATADDDDPLLFSQWQPRAEKRRSRLWLWVGGVCALLLAFCAGLLVHQRLLIPLRALGQPYEPAPATGENTPPSGQAQPSGSLQAHTPTHNELVDSALAERAAELRERRDNAAERPGIREARPSSDRELTGPAGRNMSLLPSYMAPATVGASAGMMESHLEYAPPAEYPALAKLTHIEGRVMVQAVVGRNGEVIRAEAISGHRLLRGAAVREVYDRRYRPYLLNSRPTDVATIVTVDFRLGREDR